MSKPGHDRLRANRSLFKSLICDRKGAYMTTVIGPSTPTVIRPAASVVIRPLPPAITITPSEVLRIVPRPSERIVPQTIQATRIAPVPVTTVEPPPRGAWDEKGWTRTAENGNEIFEGVYRVGTRAFRGRVIAERRGRRFTAYIYDPPPEIKSHPHGRCFQKAGFGDRWFILHWARPARSTDDAIIYMERILDESLRRRRFWGS